LSLPCSEQAPEKRKFIFLDKHINLLAKCNTSITNSQEEIMLLNRMSIFIHTSSSSFLFDTSSIKVSLQKNKKSNAEWEKFFAAHLWTALLVIYFSHFKYVGNIVVSMTIIIINRIIFRYLCIYTIICFIYTSAKAWSNNFAYE
jgi:hypothetical protein